MRLEELNWMDVEAYLKQTHDFGAWGD